jgi:hypothetical protein
MSKQSKRNRRRVSPRMQHSYRNYLVQTLGTPDGLRALSELIRDVTFAGAILLLFLSNHPFGETCLRTAAALALSKAVFRVEGHRQN